MDFAQDGEIATLHRLVDRPFTELEDDLSRWAEERPIRLVMPCLLSELDGDALDLIVDEIAKTSYLDEVIVGLDHADRAEHRRAREFFSRLPQRHRVVWNDGPRLRELDDELRRQHVAGAPPGKGRNVWWCLGYALAHHGLGAVAVHDADILGYSRELLTRLVYPVTHPTFGYAFSKGYYVRASDGRLHGRVARLLVAPLLRALATVVGESPTLAFLGDFRYPLAGEVALRAEAAAALAVPADWGLEIGMLGEVHRTLGAGQVCQVEIADTYDHKHRPLSPEDPSSGLHRMAVDITTTVFRQLVLDGRTLSPDNLAALRAAFASTAFELVDRYHNDAVMNGLVYDRGDEVQAVEVFARAVGRAGDRFLADPLGAPILPSWARVQRAVPDVLERLVQAVDADDEDD